MSCRYCIVNKCWKLGINCQKKKGANTSLSSWEDVIFHSSKSKETSITQQWILSVVRTTPPPTKQNSYQILERNWRVTEILIDMRHCKLVTPEGKVEEATPIPFVETSQTQICEWLKRVTEKKKIETKNQTFTLIRQKKKKKNHFINHANFPMQKRRTA